LSTILKPLLTEGWRCQGVEHIDGKAAAKLSACSGGIALSLVEKLRMEVEN
jgi:hypothetical protein